MADLSPEDVQNLLSDVFRQIQGVQAQIAKQKAPAASVTNVTNQTVNNGGGVTLGSLVWLTMPVTLVNQTFPFPYTGSLTYVSAAASLPAGVFPKALLVQVDNQGASGGTIRVALTPTSSLMTLQTCVNAPETVQAIVELDSAAGFYYQFTSGGSFNGKITILAYINDLGSGGGGGGGGSNTLAGLSDVTIVGPTDGFSIYYVAATGKYTLEAPRLLNEQPTGLVNNSNVTYTTSHPILSGTLYVNDFPQILGVDYTFAGSTITLIVAPVSDAQGTDVLRFYGTY